MSNCKMTIFKTLLSRDGYVGIAVNTWFETSIGYIRVAQCMALFQACLPSCQCVPWEATITAQIVNLLDFLATASALVENEPDGEKYLPLCPFLSAFQTNRNFKNYHLTVTHWQRIPFFPFHFLFILVGERERERGRETDTWGSSV